MSKIFLVRWSQLTAVYPIYKNNLTKLDIYIRPYNLMA